MKRDGWEFDYRAGDLAEAAQAKVEHHKARLEWWLAKEKAIIEEVKEKGLEVTEAVASEYATSLNLRGSMGIGPQLVVKNDYQKQLNECHGKISAHSAKVKEYSGWLQMLTDSPDNRVKLHIDDYLFFFGK